MAPWEGGCPLLVQYKYPARQVAKGRTLQVEVGLGRG